MKNVVIVPSRPAIRFPVQGFPPLEGWAVRLLIDIPDADYKKGYWMSRWSNSPAVREFAFEAESHMVFNVEADAKAVSDYLRNEAEIGTEVVKIGNPHIPAQSGS